MRWYERVVVVVFVAGMTVSAQKRQMPAGGYPPPDGGHIPVMGGAPARGSVGEQAGAPARVVFQSVAGGMGFPLYFADPQGVMVQTVMIATRASAADLATLADAPETARIRVAREGGALPGMTAAEEALTAQFRPGEWMAAEIDFADPVPLGSLAFGDTAGLGEWGRRWPGEIAEGVCFGAPPSADVRAGVANYLAVRWKFAGGQYRATAAQRQAAMGAGLNYGLAWGTFIIVR
jgi:hypothetical protein